MVSRGASTAQRAVSTAASSYCPAPSYYKHGKYHTCTTRPSYQPSYGVGSYMHSYSTKTKPHSYQNSEAKSDEGKKRTREEYKEQRSKGPLLFGTGIGAVLINADAKDEDEEDENYHKLFKPDPDIVEIMREAKLIEPLEEAYGVIGLKMLDMTMATFLKMDPRIQFIYHNDNGTLVFEVANSALLDREKVIHALNNNDYRFWKPEVQHRKNADDNFTIKFVPIRNYGDAAERRVGL